MTDLYPLYNSLRIAAISSVIVFFAGIFAAYYVAKLPRVLKGILAVILTLPALYICLALLPFGLTTKIVVTLSVVVPLGGFGLIGIGGDSLSRWVKCWWIWRRQRRLMFYRGEVHEK